MKPVFTWIIRILFLALFVFLFIKGKIMLWLALFGISLILAIFFGRLYCGYACPMNTLMNPVEWIAKKLKIQTYKAPKWLTKGFLPWVMLILSIATMLGAKKILHKNIPVLLIWVAISIFVTLRYKQAIFHNYICPFGALQKVFGSFSLIYKKVDKDKCNGCTKCKRVCPSEAIEMEDRKADIKKSLCLQCNECVRVCDKKAIK